MCLKTRPHVPTIKTNYNVSKFYRGQSWNISEGLVLKLILDRISLGLGRTFFEYYKTWVLSGRTYASFIS